MRMSHLRYFLEISRTKNISMAAKNLHVSQPSLSYAVKTIEDEIGVPLLFRHSHTISLTDAGENFAAHAKRIIDSADNLAEIMKSFAKLKAGTLRLGILWIGGYMEILTMLNGFRSRYPDVKYELSFDGSDVLLQGLSDRKFHGIFVVSSPSFLEERKEFYSVRISTEEYKLIVPQNSKLFTKSEVTVSDLAHETIIMPSEKTLLYRQLSLMFQEEGITPEVLCSTSQSDIAGQLTGAGLGIAFASSTVAEKICPENCRVIPFSEGGKIHRLVYFVMLKESLEYPLTKIFADFVAINGKMCKSLQEEG